MVHPKGVVVMITWSLGIGHWHWHRQPECSVDSSFRTHRLYGSSRLYDSATSFYKIFDIQYLTSAAAVAVAQWY